MKMKVLLGIVICSIVTASLATSGSKKTGKIQLENHYFNRLVETNQLTESVHKSAICLAFNRKGMELSPRMSKQLQINNMIIWAFIYDKSYLDINRLQNNVNEYFNKDVNTIMQMANNSKCKKVNLELVRYFS